MPTLPLDLSTKRSGEEVPMERSELEAGVVEPTENPPANVEVAVVEVAVKYEPIKLLPRIFPATESFCPGVVVPMPTLPLPSIINGLVSPPPESSTLKTVAAVEEAISKTASGVASNMPKLPALSTRRMEVALSIATKDKMESTVDGEVVAQRESKEEEGGLAGSFGFPIVTVPSPYILIPGFQSPAALLCV